MERKIGTYFPPSKGEAGWRRSSPTRRRRRIGCFARARLPPGWHAPRLRRRGIAVGNTDAIEANAPTILAANREDVERSGLEGAMRDPPASEPSAIKEMGAGGARGWRRSAIRSGRLWQSGHARRAAHPQGARAAGVVGIIYESRPNVTVDTAVLALKTGNAIVLRGGKEAARSNRGWWKFLRLFREYRREQSNSSIRAARQSVPGTDQGARAGGCDYSARRRGIDRIRHREFSAG